MNLKYQFDQEILRTRLEIQTQTFETISHELHDNVSNTLAVALLNLSLVDENQPLIAMNRVAEVRKLLLEAKHAVKDFSWSINPRNFLQSGLAGSLQELAERFNKLKLVSIQFSISGKEIPVEADRQIVIYRIVQEAISNILKHASTNEVRLSVDFSDPYLRIIIEDRGVGFNTHEVFTGEKDTQHSGIKNMMARARMINADLEIESTPGKGTTVNLLYTKRVSADPQNLVSVESVQGD